MRLSDLKKKLAKSAAPAEDVPLERTLPSERPVPVRPPASPPAAVSKPAQTSPAPAAFNLDKARPVYGRAVAEVGKALAAEGSQASGAFQVLADASAAIAELLKSGDQSLLVLTGCGTPENPAVSHSVNVAIVAVQLGAGLGWPREDLVRLGLAALLHDLGRRRSYRLGLENLSAGEAQSIRHSLKETPHLFDAFPDAAPDLKASVSTIISQLHTAGPEPAPDAVFDKLQLSAQIVTLCDLYEAMTHGYDGKPPQQAHASFKHLLGIKERFGSALVKRLIELLSPFPPGSLIQLADGRVGCVVRVNSRMLTRPLIELWLESDGKPRETPGYLDLAAEPLVAVSGPADEKKVAASGAGAKLESLRLWRGD